MVKEFGAPVAVGVTKEGDLEQSVCRYLEGDISGLS
jgi:hypothetical protein